MKRKRVLAVLILVVAVFSVFANGCAGNAEPDMDPDEWESDYSDKGPTKEIRITVDNSAYRAYDFEEWNFDSVLMIEEFFLDPEKNRDVFPEEMVDNTDPIKTTYLLKVPEDTKDLYIVPQEISKLEEKAEQEISLEQGYPIHTDYFTVLSVNDPEMTGWSDLPGTGSTWDCIGVRVNLASEIYQFPKDLEFRYNGKSFPSSGGGFQEDPEKPVIYRHYWFELPDLYTAAMAMKFGTLQYSKLETRISAKEATYACDDKTITLHVLERS